MIDTSRPGSRMSAAAMLSSRARFAGTLPCACDRTTVSLWRLIVHPHLVSRNAKLILGVDLSLDVALCLFPVVGQVLVILVDGQQRLTGTGHLEQPAGIVTIDVD